MAHLPFALIIIAIVLAVPARSQDVRLGTFAERNSSVQPGIAAGVGGLLGPHPRFTASYSTTRLAGALGSHGAVKDRFTLSAAWYFRPARAFDPYVQLDLGYARFDREDGEIFALLDNDAPLAAVLIGLEARPFGPPIGVHASVGYSILHSSTVYPFVGSIGINYRLVR